MKTTIETDLREILGKLDNHLERIDNRLSNLELNQIEIKSEIKILDEKLSGQINALDEKLSGQMNALDEKLSGQINALDEKLSGQISTLDEKVTGIDKRLDNQEFINRGILVGIILALFAGVVKLFGFFPNP
jgi:archaellum component FlaC